MYTFLLSAIWLLSGCQADTARVGERADTVRLGEVVFVQQSLMVGENPSAVAAGDLDSDGHLDLAVVNGDGVTTFRGDGRGGVVSLGQVPAGENAVDLDLADLDGNRTIDIVVANHATDYLTILLGDGKGGLRAAPNSPLRIDVSPQDRKSVV